MLAGYTPWNDDPARNGNHKRKKKRPNPENPENNSPTDEQGGNESPESEAGEDNEPGGQEQQDNRPSGYKIILDYFRQHYAPVHKHGTTIFSDTLKREVKQSEACGSCGILLICALRGAKNAPQARGGGGVDHNALPAFFRTSAPVAWHDLLILLDEETSAAEISEVAREKFLARMRGAFVTLVALGGSYKKVRVASEPRWNAGP